MAQKLAIYILSSLVISGTSMVIQRTPIPLIIPYNDDPNYTFSYNVNDPRTGDVKSQQENRRGDRVSGQYSLVQPDGIRRTVDYYSDDLQGFLATVNNERLEIRPLPTEGVRAEEDKAEPCEDCSIDPRINSDATRQQSNSRQNENTPLQWQVDYTNIHSEPKALPRQNDSQAPRERNDNRQTQKPVDNERNEVQNFPVASSRTSIIQRIDNNQPVLVANIPWV